MVGCDAVLGLHDLFGPVQPRAREVGIIFIAGLIKDGVVRAPGLDPLRVSARRRRAE